MMMDDTGDGGGEGTTMVQCYWGVGDDNGTTMCKNNDNRDDDRDNNVDVWWNERWEEELECQGKQPWLAVATVSLASVGSGGRQQRRTKRTEDSGGQRRQLVASGNDGYSRRMGESLSVLAADSDG